MDDETVVKDTPSATEDSLKKKTCSILKHTKNCVMRKCRAHFRPPEEGATSASEDDVAPSPAPAPVKSVGFRGILRRSSDKRALGSKMAGAASEASEPGGREARTRCLIGRVPRRGAGVSLTVRRPNKQGGSVNKLQQLMRKRSC